MKRRDTPEIRAARDFFAYLRRLDLKRMETETLDVLDRASRTPRSPRFSRNASAKRPSSTTNITRPSSPAATSLSIRRTFTKKRPISS